MRIAFYGGSFDPVHAGHLAIAHELTSAFDLDRFVFVPAFHAPHKVRLLPTSSYCRYAMLCLATAESQAVSVSRIELELAERQYTVDTLRKLKQQLPDDDLFFVMGADSWEEITTWHEWETVLSMVNHIVVSRPGHELATDHVTDKIRALIGHSIFFTKAVNMDVSATRIRANIRQGDVTWTSDVPKAVAEYIIKYQLYR